MTYKSDDEKVYLYIRESSSGRQQVDVIPESEVHFKAKMSMGKLFEVTGMQEVEVLVEIKPKTK